MFLVIGLILIAGGIKAIKDPRSPIATMGGNRYNPTVSYQAIPPQGSHSMGYTSIGLGVAAIAAGLSSKILFTPTDSRKRTAAPSHKTNTK